MRQKAKNRNTGGCIVGDESDDHILQFKLLVYLLTERGKKKNGIE